MNYSFNITMEAKVIDIKTLDDGCSVQNVIQLPQQPFLYGKILSIMDNYPFEINVELIIKVNMFQFKLTAGTQREDVANPEEIMEVILLMSPKFRLTYMPHNMAILDVSH